mmetsp:Transcript_17552/g.41338  ORF Transcript_17552/g.41338 Transcript_17552/m.41338 type:complete len:233 (-) Transcript_17552:2799-3497(-)
MAFGPRAAVVLFVGVAALCVLALVAGPSPEDVILKSKDISLKDSKQAYLKADSEVQASIKQLDPLIKSLRGQEKEQKSLRNKELKIRQRIHKVIFESSDPTAKKELDSIEKAARALIEESRKAKHSAVLMDSKAYDDMRAAESTKTKAMKLLKKNMNKMEKLPAKKWDRLVKVVQPLRDQLRGDRNKLLDRENSAQSLSRQAQDINRIESSVSKLLTTVAKLRYRRNRHAFD